ncbi:MAG: hypothetical protein IKD75_08515 [Prevotella sp.]|nr:hypothetical protein [Prevotella sp.]
MEQITLGQLAGAVALLGGLITGATIIMQNLKKWIEKALNEKFNGIDLRLDQLTEAVEDERLESCKDFLVTTLNEISTGQHVDESVMPRFWERYDYYTGHGGNSYIRERVNQLKEKGLL